MADLCVAEIETLRTVKTPAGAYVPIYRDLELTAYLSVTGNGLAGPRMSDGPISVLPVYSVEPLIFHTDLTIFVSVTYLLPLDEEQVRRVIADEIAHMQSRHRGRRLQTCLHCAILAPSENATFREIWSRLAREVAQYEEVMRPILVTN